MAIAGRAFPIRGITIKTRIATARVYTLALDVGSYSLTGASAQFVVTAPLGVGAYTITGQSAALLQSHVLGAAVGSYSITGQSAALLKGYALLGDAGSYSITGYSAQFVVAAPAGVGAYTITGQSASLVVSRMLGAAVGSYALTGIAAALNPSNVVVTTPVKRVGGAGIWQAETLSRQPKQRRRLRLKYAGGAYSISGTPAALTVRRHYRLKTEPNSYVTRGTITARLAVHRVMRSDKPIPFSIIGFAADASYKVSFSRLEQQRLIEHDNAFLLAS